MSILIKTVRISGLRGLENIEMDLEQTTILTGMNNSGKSSILRALQLALGNHQFISQDDFFIKDNQQKLEIIVDVLIVPTNSNDERCSHFDEKWEEVFTVKRITIDKDGNNSVSFRTTLIPDTLNSGFEKKQYTIKEWPEFKKNNTYWFAHGQKEEISFSFKEIPFFYIESQRDIIKDVKRKNSYIGRIVSSIKYSDKDIEEIEKQLETLNEMAVRGSSELSQVKKSLDDLKSTMDAKGSVEINPFTGKIRDLNKGLSIQYADRKDYFSMEYHGMGTRSWSSLLVLKAFILLRDQYSTKQEKAFFPIIALEEPEAHLHPNAQRTLYSQINSMVGQKIISTHSPYLASHAEMNQLRNLYRRERIECGLIEKNSFSDSDMDKIKTHVLNTKGEIIFSQCVVFMEGQTERDSLPVFAENFFKKHPSSMGINFVDVGGKNYSPFIKFTEALRISWLIFSDAEKKTVETVQQQVLGLFPNERLENDIIFLNENCNFETYLIKEGYQQEIKDALKSIIDNSNPKYKKEKEKEIQSYDDETLLGEMKSNNKIKIGKAVAEIMTSRDKTPKKINELFVKIKNLLSVK